ncbi:hypothetical protein BU24DRAFT_392656 [Aaosphaeria arxii CBS 175.79]|uniref:Zn(2)-C6 fungal-type domain-containing protein n=1 Tax=Aaosphaeria arxii CBS 175.79 TaxID=1450172 RepID=A0A6A5XNN7_9PLEO|nr:uncharacterized protein BU24DRAFT_392656 [Aaosphaeria arxii CBS 175.79]KAF2014553.1 hypothetical protein BU24DRAFT_392656 [Aaosphaeria arxii CBS 175.79]
MDNDDRPRRKRARQACTVCNARRVKCNVIERQPCDNCIAANVRCETRESRRGKHIRRSRASETAEHEHRHRLLSASSDPRDDTLSPTSLRRDDDEVAASHVLASLSTNFNGHKPPPPSSEQESAPSITANNEQEDDGAVYLGESSSLRYVPAEATPAQPSSKRPRLRHSIPNAAKAQALMPQWEADRRRARIKALRDEGAFSFPPASVQEDLLKSYFCWFHPHFAIVDEDEIWRGFASGSLSPLLLQAMLFIGVIHCEPRTVEQLGWGNRHRAKYIFYSKAKDIYDADFETRKLTIIQSLFLLSFWRARALEEKDVRFWLGAVINLAHTKALHRSSGTFDASVVGLRRRIWWSIYIRERQAAAALGLPSRIREDDCDVGFLSHHDFQTAFGPSVPAASRERHATYAIEMMQLARTLGQIVDAGYLPNRHLSTSDRTNIRDWLYNWKQHLPPSIQITDGVPTNNQASMLHLAYNNLLILLHRSAFISQPSEFPDADGSIALQAAARNSRIIEDMLADGTMGHAQVHVITNLFNTLCIHVAHLRQSNGINRTIAEHRAKLCLLGLQEMQKTWELTNWILQLFFQYLDRSTAKRLAVEADDGASVGGGGNAAVSVSEPPGLAAGPGTPGDVEAGLQRDGKEEVGGNGELDAVMTPWSWTTDEANQYLFSQIENEFSFGAGGMLEWNTAEMLADDGNLLDEFGRGGLPTSN